MRKFTLLLAALALLLNLGTVALAESPDLEIPDMPAQAGQTVYVSVVLNKSVTGDAIGISYSYDSSLLEALPDSSIWEKDSILEDFSNEDSGVWASTKAQDLSGKLCTLAFRLKSDASFTETKVSCTVTIKNGPDTAGTFAAEGRIYMLCEHRYGQWTDAENRHSRTCELCGKAESQSHSWDNGSSSAHPTNPALCLVTYTCTGCGATRTVETTGTGLPQTPTEEAPPTAPTEEVPTMPPIETMPPQQELPIPSPSVPTPTNPAPGNQQNNHSGNQSRPGNQNTSGSGNNTQTTDPTEPTLPEQNLSDFNTSDKPADSQTGTTGNQHTGNTGNSGNSGNGGQTGSGKNQGTGTQQSPGAPTEAPEAPPAETPVTGDSHDHTHQNNSNPPVGVPIPEGAAQQNTTQESIPGTTPPTAEHTHDHEPQAPQISVVPLILATLCVAAAVGLSLILIKLNKRK